MSSNHYRPFFDALNDRLFSHAVHDSQPESAKVIPIRAELPQSDKLVPREEYDRLVKAVDDGMGHALALSHIVTIVSKPFAHPCFDRTRDEADRYRAIREYLESAGMVGPEPSFAFSDPAQPDFDFLGEADL